MNKKYSKVKKYSVLVCFTFIFFFVFIIDLEAATLKCWYKSSSMEASFSVNTNKTSKITFTKWNGKKKEYTAKIDNADSLEKDYDRLNCPNFIVLGSGSSDKVKQNIFKGFWVEESATKFKKTLKEKYGTVITMKQSKEVITKTCYYDKDGNLTMGSDANKDSYSIRQKGSNDIKFDGKSSTYYFRGKPKDFYNADGKFECAPKTYICIDNLSQGSGVASGAVSSKFEVFTSAPEKCKAPVNENASNNNTDQELEDDRQDDPAETDKDIVPKGLCQIIDPNGETYSLIRKVVQYIQIGTIFLILILGMMDLAGAVGSDKDDAFKKAIAKFGKRLIAGVLIFLVPVIVSFILNLVNLGACGGSLTDEEGNKTSGYDLFR